MTLPVSEPTQSYTKQYNLFIIDFEEWEKEFEAIVLKPFLYLVALIIDKFKLIIRYIQPTLKILI